MVRIATQTILLKVVKVVQVNNATDVRIGRTVLLPSTTYKAYLPNTDFKITRLTKEGLGNHSTILTLGIMIYQHSFLFTLKRFCQLHYLMLESDKKLGIGFEFTEQLLRSGDRMISIEGFHGFVV